jgi:hypothetical protein
MMPSKKVKHWAYVTKMITEETAEVENQNIVINVASTD